MKSLLARSLSSLIVLSAVFIFSITLMPTVASAAAVNVTTVTATSSNAATAYAKLGDTVNYQLTLDATPWVAPQINIFNLGSTTMTGSAGSWWYSTTTNSANAWTNDAAVTFMMSIGSTTAATVGTTTISQANLTGSNVTYDTGTPTTPTGLSTQVFHGSAAFTLAATDEVEVTTIRYTTDGTTPTCTTGTVYSSAVTVNQSATINAVACDPAGNISAVANAVYSPAVGGGGSAPAAAAPAQPAVPATPATPATSVTPAVPATPAIPAVPATPATPTTPVAPSAHDVLVGQVSALVSSVKTQDLAAGKKGEPVRSLQAFLIAQAKGNAATMLAQTGATAYFGGLTKAALAEYQKSVGITPASGYFGPKTRAYINSLAQ